MHLLPSAEQTQIIETVRDFLEANAPVSRFREARSLVGNRDANLWAGLSELGLLGASLPEDAGGAGLGPVEDVLLFREYGRFLISPSVLAMTLGARLAWRAGCDDLATAILCGQTGVSLAHPRRGALVGQRCSGSFQLFDGGAPWVLALDEEGAALLPGEAFRGFERVVATDSVLTLDRGELQDTPAKLWLPASEDALTVRAALLLGAYAVGIAEATRDMAVAYARMREQFGRPIGSFQAVKHRCAEMAIRAEAALCQSWFAAGAMDAGQADAAFQARACKIVASRAALDNAASNIQVHGAIGFTAEIDAHLYLKRAHVADTLAGALRQQKSALLKEPAPP